MKLLPLDLHKTLLMQTRNMGWKDTERALIELADAPAYVSSRSAVIEECAKVCDARVAPPGRMTAECYEAQQCAKAIRALACEGGSS